MTLNLRALASARCVLQACCLVLFLWVCFLFSRMELWRRREEGSETQVQVLRRELFLEQKNQSVHKVDGPDYLRPAANEVSRAVFIAHAWPISASPNKASLTLQMHLVVFIFNLQWNMLKFLIQRAWDDYQYLKSVKKECLKLAATLRFCACFL